VNVGNRVRIERDETEHPSKGTWPQFRGKTGTVVEINRDRQRPHLTEYGVTFGKTYPRTDGSRGLWRDGEPVTWFKSYEITPL
jgi:hypothetical protein